MRACQSRYLRSRVNFWSVDRSMRSIKYYSIKFSTEWTVLNRCVFIYIYNSDYYAGLIIFRLSSRCWPNWLVWTFPATPTTATRTWGHRLHYRLCRQIQRLGISWHVLWSWLVSVHYYQYNGDWALGRGLRKRRSGDKIR